MLNQKLMGKTGEDKQFIEDLFAVHLYTGNGSTQTIDNGIDLAGKGGMVWTKTRGVASNNWLYSTAQGTGGTGLISNDTASSSLYSTYNNIQSFNSNGFTLGTASTGNQSNPNGTTAVSWTFRKAPKFFDVVTYTGDGNFSRQVSHNLGITPGMIIIKRTDTSTNWVAVCRRDSGTLDVMYLNTTGASKGGLGNYPSSQAYVSPSSFGPEWLTVAGVTQAEVNASGATYVAYLFAHDTTTDGLIQCGSYTGNSSTSGPTVTLGWEPQYVMVKNATGATGWRVIDNMRGMGVTSNSMLEPNTSAVEVAVTPSAITPNATGFQITNTGAGYNSSGSTYIYMAIRRGPMRTPTDGTKVFNIVQAKFNGTINVPASTSDFIDTVLWKSGQATSSDWWLLDKLRGIDTVDAGTNTSKLLTTTSTSAESNAASQSSNSISSPRSVYRINNRIVVTPGNTGGYGHLVYGFQRAPGFFDVVCYTGNSVAGRSINHNLGIAPELIIVKRRDTADLWTVRAPSTTGELYLNLTNAQSNAFYYIGIPSSTTFLLLNGGSQINGSGSTYVAYLFASCPGVSKVGSYTGNGSSQTINCGFTAGARFVLIKRTDSTGDWMCSDSSRGIVAASDPRLNLNTTAAEVTTDDWLDPDASGFIVNQTTASNANVTGASYIFLAIS